MQRGTQILIVNNDYEFLFLSIKCVIFLLILLGSERNIKIYGNIKNTSSVFFNEIYPG